MKRQVTFDSSAVTVSSAILLGFMALAAIFYMSDLTIGWVAVCVLLVGICIPTLYFMPRSVSVDEDAISLHFPLRTKQIPLSEVESVRRVAPPKNALRLCASDGFGGYWGWISEPKIGKYFAYYGNASERFLVRLKSGKQYMLGCSAPDEMTAYIHARLK